MNDDTEEPDATRGTEEVTVDLTEQRDEILVGAELPGFRKQDLDVSASERTVTIEAKTGSRRDHPNHRSPRTHRPDAR